MGWGAWGQSERFYSCIPETSPRVLEGTPGGEVGPGWRGRDQAHSASVHRGAASSWGIHDGSGREAPSSFPLHRFSPSPHTLCSSPPPFPTAKENSLTDPSPEALLLGQTSMGPHPA